MTKRKQGGHSQLEENLYRARWLASHLENDEPLPADARLFLSAALRRIGDGEDANVALGVNAGRGERKSRQLLIQRDKKIFALAWIANAIAPHDDDGLGLPLDDAFARAAEDFGFSEESLRTYWNESPENRARTFRPPLSSEPIKRG